MGRIVRVEHIVFGAKAAFFLKQTKKQPRRDYESQGWLSEEGFLQKIKLFELDCAVGWRTGG